MTGVIDHHNDHSADELDALRARLNAALDADSSPASSSSAENKPIAFPAPSANWRPLHSLVVFDTTPRRMTRGDWFRVVLAIVVVAAVVWVLRSV
jgi:hypothetical protein